MRAALLAAGLLAGCGPADRLEGTISADATLDFDAVRAEWLVDRLSVRYLRGEGRTLQEPARLTLPAAAAVEGAELAVEDLVLVEHFATVDDATGRVTMEKPFPPVQQGTLKLKQVGQESGQHVVGEFHVVFTGAQDTLNGSFTATVAPPG